MVAVVALIYGNKKASDTNSPMLFMPSESCVVVFGERLIVQHPVPDQLNHIGRAHSDSVLPVLNSPEGNTSEAFAELRLREPGPVSYLFELVHVLP